MLLGCPYRDGEDNLRVLFPSCPPLADFFKKVAKNPTSVSDVRKCCIDVLATKSGQPAATSHSFAHGSRFIKMMGEISIINGNILTLLDPPMSVYD